MGIPSSCGLPLWPPIVGGHSGNTVELWPPGNTVQLWPPTVASHCGLPLWEAMGIPLKIALNQFAYVFLREATGGHSWRPWEYHSQLLLINFTMFSYGRPRASHCGLPLWEAMGIPLKIAFDKFPYVFLPEAMGGHSGRPWEYHSKLLLINFLMFSYRRPREATGGHGNTARAHTPDLNSLFFLNVRTPNSVR